MQGSSRGQKAFQGLKRYKGGKLVKLHGVVGCKGKVNMRMVVDY